MLGTINNGTGSSKDNYAVVRIKTIPNTTVSITKIASFEVSNSNLQVYFSDTWNSKISNPTGSYIFIYNGTNWTLNNSTVNLSEYGLDLYGSPEINDTITVTYIDNAENLILDSSYIKINQTKHREDYYLTIDLLEDCGIWTIITTFDNQTVTEWMPIYCFIGNIRRFYDISVPYYLFNNGYTCDVLTGGWSASGYSVNNNSVAGSITNNVLTLNGGSSKPAIIGTVNKIDISPFNYICYTDTIVSFHNDNRISMQFTGLYPNKLITSVSDAVWTLNDIASYTGGPYNVYGVLLKTSEPATPIYFGTTDEQILGEYYFVLGSGAATDCKFTVSKIYLQT